MDIVKDAKIEWLRFKWLFMVTSLLFAAVGAASLVGRGLNLGIDFTGGTLVYVKFKEAPDIERVRRVLSAAELNAEGVTRFDDPSTMTSRTAPTWSRFRSNVISFCNATNRSNRC